jgi:hypothetical protein
MADNNGAVQAAGLEIFPVEIACGDCQVRADKGDPGMHLFAAQNNCYAIVIVYIYAFRWIVSRILE